MSEINVGDIVTRNNYGNLQWKIISVQEFIVHDEFCSAMSEFAESADDCDRECSETDILYSATAVGIERMACVIVPEKGVVARIPVIGSSNLLEGDMKSLFQLLPNGSELKRSNTPWHEYWYASVEAVSKV